MSKKPSFAGMFYPEKPEELTNLLNSFKQEDGFPCKSKAIIVPHAGMYYSGHAAMAAYQRLEPNETIFIIAPSHHFSFENIAMPKFTFFDTPLGSIEVNNKIIREINEKFPSIIENEFFEKEHSIEVQLPFLQNVFYPHIQNAIDFVKEFKNIVGHKFKIVPIIVGNCDYRLISDLIAEYWDRASFVISSDLSHYYTYKECQQIDTYTATIIETGKIECLQPQQGCGLIGIKGLVDFANKHSSSLIRIMTYNSGDITKDKSKVVGYGSWFLYPDTKNNYIKNFYSNYVINTAKASLLYALNSKEYVPEKIPQVLAEYGASFVTLKLNGELRGCIGSVYPTKPLILDIIDNARNAGFTDSRFEPLTEREFNSIEISVSILSEIKRINFKDERDLLSKIYPHGVIIAERNRRAVYLPVVWEQLPDKEVFLRSLKVKAGLSPDYFSKTFEAYSFEAIQIYEQN